MCECYKGIRRTRAFNPNPALNQKWFRVLFVSMGKLNSYGKTDVPMGYDICIKK